MSFPRFFQKSSRDVNRRRRAQRRLPALTLEALEDRITPTVTLNNGHLIINGDEGGPHDDTITIGINGSLGGVLVSLNGKYYAFNPNQVSSIECNPGNSSNSVDVHATLPGVPLTVNCTATPTPYQDHVRLGIQGSRSGDLDPLAGPITVNGNGLTNVELWDNLKNGDDTYTVTKSFISRPGFGSLTYTGIYSLLLVGESGAGNIYNVPNTASFTATSIEANGDDNTYNVGTGDLSAIQGPVILINGENASQGSCAVVLHDEASLFSHTYSTDVSGTWRTLSRDGFDLLTTLWGQPVTVDAGGGNDIFSVSPTGEDLGGQLTPLTLNGGGGSNTLYVYDQNAPSAESYSVTSTSISRPIDFNFTARTNYSGIQAVTVNGSNQGSTFAVSSLALNEHLRINAGDGVNNVNVGNASNRVDLNDFQGSLGVNGAPLGFTTVTLNDQGNPAGRNFLLHLNEVVLGLDPLVSYSGIESLVLNGGPGHNTFQLLDTAVGLFTTINAGTQADSVLAGGPLTSTVDALQGPVVINGQGNTTFTVYDQSAATPQTYTVTGTATGEFLACSGGLSATCNRLNLTVNGGSGGNQFVVTTTPPTLVTLNGGSGSNTLTGPNNGNHITSWVISGPGSGKIGKRVPFSAMHDLSGAGAIDIFQFTAAGSIAGTLSGGGNNDEVSYALEAGPVSVNLQTHAAPQINGGLAGGFRAIPVFVGSASAADTLIGPDLDTAWTVSSAGGGFGSGSGFKFTFSKFEKLVGGSGLDVFKFGANGSLAGGLDGGGAPPRQGNWLDYSGLAAAVSVNLQTGAASKVAGGAAGKVANIRNVHGGNGGNTLTGNAQGNILIGGTGADTIVGGTGRSLLIGDKGSDSVTGHSSNDILIGGLTKFDAMTAANESALMAILAEWQSADSYADRFGDINQGAAHAGGSHLNGASLLKTGTGATVLDDTGAADTLTEAGAGTRQDWFFQYAGDTINNQPGEHVNNT
jgi:hypothetical protein